MGLAETLTELLTRSGSLTGAALLGGAAGLKYVFPPFPTDIVIVSGVFLIARGNAALAVVAAAVLVGSAIGFMLAYAIGRAIGNREEHWQTGWRGRAKPKIDLVIERFSRHGLLLVAANRFVPGVRSLIFLAAGMAKLPVWRVFFCGLVGAAVWNAILFALGMTFGGDSAAVQRFLTLWGVAFGVAIAVIVGVVLLVRVILKRRAQ